jgi:DNA-binding response OmpR family regulator
VLIVEDDPAIAQLLQEEIAERLGLDMSVIANGALAPDAIAVRRPDLLILDVALPGLSGVDVFDIVRGTAAHDGIPVLFLTANPDQVTASVQDAKVMSKPFDNDELVAVIAEMLGIAVLAA